MQLVEVMLLLLRLRGPDRAVLVPAAAGRAAAGRAGPG
jgi:hypothetical protein